jgi:mono/diheme cytochrome c family protein
MTSSLRIGALGVLLAAGAFAAPGQAQAQEPAAKAAFTVDKNLANKGKGLWTARGCTGCHTIGKGKLAGPDLAGVIERRDMDWLKRWLKESDTMVESDPIAKQLYEEYNKTLMPNMKLKPEEIDALIHFIGQESAKKK